MFTHNKPRILCVCKGNTCRSPMLMGFIRSVVTEWFNDAVVDSAGTYDGVEPDCRGKPASLHSAACMAIRDIDITDHTSRPISEVDVNNYDFVICMSPAEYDFVVALRPAGAVILANADGDGVPNPWQQGLDVYDACAAVLERVARDFVNRYLAI